MGIFIFWLHYIIAFILLWQALKCIYVKTQIKIKKSYYDESKYEITENDERLKHPLWEILILIISTLVPVWNILFLGSYLVAKTSESDSKYYLKSFLTKKY